MPSGAAQDAAMLLKVLGIDRSIRRPGLLGWRAGLAVFVFAWGAQAREPVVVLLSPEPAAARSTCVHWGRVRAETERGLGRTVFTEDSSRAHVRLDVHLQAAPLALELSLHETDGTALGWRRVEAKGCGELSESLVLVLSLMLDFSVDDVPALRAARAESEGAVNPTQPKQNPTQPKQNPTQPKQNPSQPTPQQTEPKPSATFDGDTSSLADAQVRGWRLELFGAISAGWAPEPRTGWGAKLGVELWPLTAELSAATGFAAELDHAGGSVSLERRSLALALLGTALELPALEGQLGVRVAVHHSSAEGRNYAAASGQSFWAAQPALLASAHSPLWRGLFLRMAVAAGPVLGRGRLYVATPTGDQTVFTMGQIWADLELGAGWVWR